MASPTITADQLDTWLSVGGPILWPGDSRLVTVDLSTRADEPDKASSLPPSMVGWPVVMLGIGEPELHERPLGRAMDLCLVPDDPVRDAVEDTVRTHPEASTALVIALRAGEHLPPANALVIESTTYSTLQSGQEFRSWLEHHRTRRRARRDAAVAAHENPPVRIEVFDPQLGEEGPQVHVVLQRAHRHNAIDRRLRLELHDALRTAALVPGATVLLRGDGPSFSSGGDLDEFGSFVDPAGSHLARMAHHPALALIDLGPSRLRAHVHGSTFGGGLEVAAFAGHVVADPESVLSLPEVSLGLVPGAGGTVSIPRRIGRQRTARLCLTLERLSAAEALAWGLVDEIAAVHPDGDPQTLRR